MLVSGHHRPPDRERRRRADRPDCAAASAQVRSRSREPVLRLIAGPRHVHSPQGMSWAWMSRQGRGMTAPQRGQDLLMRYVELRRHTDNDGDRLTRREWQRLR